MCRLRPDRFTKWLIPALSMLFNAHFLLFNAPLLLICARSAWRCG
jgi:hypothetical protein